MRRTAHCLILLLAPVAAHAAEAIDTPARSGCTYAPGEVERVAAPAASVVGSPSADIRWSASISTRP